MLRLQGYASRTGTRRNLAVLRAAGWRLLVAAQGVHRSEGFRYMLDNSAYTYWTNGIIADWRDDGNAGAPFLKLLRTLGGTNEIDQVVAPDIVCGGPASLGLSISWLPRLQDSAPVVLVPVQPGITPAMLAGLLGPTVGVFVGGGSEWKEATCAAWSALAHGAGARCHVGRVNTQRRVGIVKAAGADSFDGSSVSRYAVTMPEIERAMVRPAQRNFEADMLDLEGTAGSGVLLASLRQAHTAARSPTAKMPALRVPSPRSDDRTMDIFDGEHA